MFITQCDGGIRRFFRFEAFTDERHDKDAKKVMIPTTDMSCLFTETVIFQILGYLAQFRPIQTDAPRYLCPQQEHWDGGKTTINGIVT